MRGNLQRADYVKTSPMVKKAFARSALKEFFNDDLHSVRFFNGYKNFKDFLGDDSAHTIVTQKSACPI